jgi:hypothetical protein
VVPRIAVKQPVGDPELLAKVQLSRALVELRRDVPLPKTLDELVARPWDLPALHQLFTELEFGQLVEKVKLRMPPGDDVVVVPAPETTALAASPAGQPSPPSPPAAGGGETTRGRRVGRR